MNIVYVTTEFVTEKRYAGLGRYLDNITTVMKKKGHNVTVITLSDKNQEFYYQDIIRVIRVRALVTDMVSSELEKVLFQIRNSWRLYRVLQKLNKIEKIDIVQSANIQSIGFFRCYSIPTVVRVSSDSTVWRLANEIKFDYNQALTEKHWSDWLELSCIKRADNAYAPSKCCASMLKKRSGKKLQIIESPYCCRDIQMDESIYERQLMNKKYLLFNSSLCQLKGTHLGINATKVFMEKYPDLYMVYAGIDYGLAGSRKSVTNILKQQSRKYQGRVIYLHNLKQEQLFPVIEHALACILPSRVDNLPNSCIEAMSLGKIVIGTYGASFEQLIKNKENGLLIKRDSTKALIRAVEYLMTLTEKERLDMGKKARDTTARLNPDIIYNHLIQYYQKVIKMYYKNKWH